MKKATDMVSSKKKLTSTDTQYIHKGYIKTIFHTVSNAKNINLFSRQHLDSRLTQLIYRFSRPYILKPIEKESRRTPKLPHRSKYLSVGENYIHSRAMTLFVFSGYFILQWLNVILQFLRNFNFQNNRTQYTLIYGIGEESFANGNEHRLFDFFLRGPITSLHDKSFFVVQSQRINGSQLTDSDRTLLFTKNPLLFALRHSGLSLESRIKLIWGHIKHLFFFAISIVIFPPNVLMARDFAVQSAANILSDEMAISLVLVTNSMVMEQPMWMRNRETRSFPVEMAWYSQNSAPIALVNEGAPSEQYIFSFIQVDKHWIWSEDFQEWNGHPGPNEAVGPILWYRDIDRPQSNIDRRKSFRIVVFTITPFVDKAFDELGLIYSFMSPKAMTDFVSSILSATQKLRREGFDIELVFKDKRNHSPQNAPSYITLMKDIDDNEDAIVERTDINIYSLLQNTDLVVGVPFTSAALVAKALDIDTIFFDSTETILPMPHQLEGVEFASGYSQFEMLITDKIQSYNNASK